MNEHRRMSMHGISSSAPRHFQGAPFPCYRRSKRRALLENAGHIIHDNTGVLHLEKQGLNGGGYFRPTGRAWRSDKSGRLWLAAKNCVWSPLSRDTDCRQNVQQAGLPRALPRRYRADDPFSQDGYRQKTACNLMNIVVQKQQNSVFRLQMKRLFAARAITAVRANN